MSPLSNFNGLSSGIIFIRKSCCLFLKKSIFSIISPCVHAMIYERKDCGKSFNSLSCKAKLFSALELFSKCLFIL